MVRRFHAAVGLGLLISLLGLFGGAALMASPAGAATNINMDCVLSYTYTSGIGTGLSWTASYSNGCGVTIASYRLSTGLTNTAGNQLSEGRTVSCSNCEPNGTSSGIDATASPGSEYFLAIDATFVAPGSDLFTGGPTECMGLSTATLTCRYNITLTDPALGGSGSSSVNNGDNCDLLGSTSYSPTAGIGWSVNFNPNCGLPLARFELVTQLKDASSNLVATGNPVECASCNPTGTSAGTFAEAVPGSTYTLVVTYALTLGTGTFNPRAGCTGGGTSTLTCQYTTAIVANAGALTSALAPVLAPLQALLDQILALLGL